MLAFKGKYTTAKVFATTIDKSAMDQIWEIVDHPAFTGPIAIMPDVHVGAGCVIGFTMPLGDQVIPNIIGVDIGCGVVSYNFGDKYDIDFDHLDKDIRSQVPMGRDVFSDRFAVRSIYTCALFASVRHMTQKLYSSLKQRFGNVPEPPVMDAEWFSGLCDKVGMDAERALDSIGTLGGGNHFIEVGKDSSDNIWVTIHSGSRQLGKKICDYHQGVADRGDRRDYQEAVNEVLQNTQDKDKQLVLAKLRKDFSDSLFPKGLNALTGDALYEYLYDMVFAQHYAIVNRRFILSAVGRCLEKHSTYAGDLMDLFINPVLESVHNYIDPDDLVIRKGAVSATLGKTVLIPFNMRDGVLLCEGLGNEDWNCSAPHGAGRLLGRRQANRELDKKVAEAQMDGIYTSCIPLDEAPDAYKPASEIRSLVGSTVKVLDKIKPIMNIKAG